jgi:hypothetical protein
MDVTENGVINLGDPRMKNLLTVSAVIEVGVGFALVVIPSAAFRLLLGSSLNSPAALIFARWTAVVLLTVGVGCWLMRRESESIVAKGLVSAMLLYNASVSVVLVYARLGLGLSGNALWPFVLLHAVMTGWCIIWLLDGPVKR